MAADRRGQRCEVLALAIAAEDHDQPGRRMVLAQAVQRRHRRADVRALAVVVRLHAADDGHRAHTVRLAGVLAQAVQHRRQRAVDRGGQRQRGQRVGRVVAAADAQRVGRHHALQVDLFLVALAPLDRFVSGHGAHQPGHTTLGDQAEVARMTRRVQPVARDPATDALRRLAPAALDDHRFRHHGLDLRVVAVDHHDRALAVDQRLRRRVGRHAAVPVQVVLRDVQHHGGAGLETARAVELEAGQLQHPDLGQRREHRVDLGRRRQLQRALVGVFGPQGVGTGHGIRQRGLLFGIVFRQRAVGRLAGRDSGVRCALDLVGHGHVRLCGLRTSLFPGRFNA